MLASLFESVAQTGNEIQNFFSQFFSRHADNVAGWMWPLQTSSQAEASDWRVIIAAMSKKKKKMQTHGENNWGCCCMSHTAPAKNGSVSLWEEGSTCSLVRSFHSRSLILLSKENSESVHSTLDGWTCCSVNITHQQTQKMFLKKNVFNTLCCANSRYSQSCCCCRRHFIWFPLAKSLNSGMYHLHNMKAFSCLLLCTQWLSPLNGTK